MTAGEEILSVAELSGYLEGQGGVRRILDGVDLQIRAGESTALLGASGSGKTFLALSVLGLHPGLPGLVGGSGRIMGVDLFDGLWRWVRCESRGSVLRVAKDPAAWSAALRRRLQPLLGRRVTLVPQDPLTTLPPFFPIAKLMQRAIRRNGREYGRRQLREAARHWLDRVHMYGVDEVLRSHPHELSGGMAQRVALALALAPEPDLLLADEPTTGLDATLRVRVLELLAEAVHEVGVTLFLITHDTEAARLLVRQVAILCGGRIVERGPAEQVLNPRLVPKHPYTRFLLEAETCLAGQPLQQRAVRGEVAAFEVGCGYRGYCPLAEAVCAQGPPPLTPVAVCEGDANAHEIACWKESR